MWLLLLMILVMPYEANPYLYLADDLLGIFPDFTLIKLLGLLGFAWAGLRIMTGDGPPGGLLGSRIARLFLLFFAGVVFAGLFSGTGFTAVSRYLAFLLFLPFVLMAVRGQRDLRMVLYALALSLILVFPYALRQMIRFDSRLGVGLYETNYFAAILVLVIPLAFVVALQQPAGLKRWGWMGGALTLLGMLFLTSSRGGVVGLLAAAMVFVYRRQGALGALGVMAALVVAIFVLPTDLGTRALATLFQDSADLPPGLEESNRAHTALFWAALRMISENPLLGVGPARFKELSTLYTDVDVPAHIAHNTFLEIGAEFGLPVLGVFVLLVLAALGTLSRAMRLRGSAGARELAGWAEGLRAGLIGFLVCGLFISAQYEKVFWLAIFLTIPVGVLARRYQAQARAGETPAAAEATAPRTGPGLTPAPEGAR